MKKNKKQSIIIIGIIITLLYGCLVAFYLYNLQSFPERYANIEQETISTIEDKVRDTLNKFPINLKEIDALVDEYTFDIVIVSKEGELYKSKPGLNEKNFFEVVDKRSVLFESQGNILSNAMNYNVFLRIYQFPSDAFILPFLSQQITLLGITFLLLVLGLFVLIASILKPLKTVKKGISHLSKYEFSEVKAGGDAISKKLSDVSVQIEDNMDTISREYSLFETELETTRQRLNNTMLVSRSFIHDFKTPIHQQIMSNEIVINGDEEEVYTPESVAHMNINLGEHLMMRVNEVLKIMNEDLYDIADKGESFDLIALTYDTLRYFGKQFSQKGLEVEIDSEEQFMVTENKVIMQLLIHNLMSNIANYAKEDSTLYIRIKRKDGIMTMAYDNESTPDSIERMMKSEQLFNVVNENYKYSSRNGLFLIRDLTELMGGTYECIPEETRVTVAIKKALR